MAVTVSYPGVYVEEIASGVRTIVGVSTARTAFVGLALQGPVDEPTLIFSFADYERTFGGLWADSTMSFAVKQYFDNGGGEAVIVRVFVVSGSNDTAAIPLGTGISLAASSPGTWGGGLNVVVDHHTRTPGVAGLVNITVRLNTVEVETLRNVNVADLETTLAQRSLYLRYSGTAITDITDTAAAGVNATGGADGTPLTNSTPLIGGDNGTTRTGMNALANTDIFNILCLPPPVFGGEIANADSQVAANFCFDHRAIFLVDPPNAATRPNNAIGPIQGKVILNKKNAAAFFPLLLASNPLSGMIEEFVPCGAVAGVFARTDAQRGVWKAPAGIDAGLSGVSGLTYTLTDPENGLLNKEAVNCLRTFPTIGRVVWGARTMDGPDSIGSEWKYVPVRRLALYMEESLFRGLKWVVFEPNDAPLWAQIRLNVGAFMNNLFRQGAFQGASPKDAYFVRCDSSTTTQNDINLGIVNILVGFAPLKPAEFVILKIQQIAGQIQV
jgi:phage tail sheath protein FI